MEAVSAEGFAELLACDGLIAVHRDTLLEVYDLAPWEIVEALLIAEAEDRMMENQWCQRGTLFAIRKPEPITFPLPTFAPIDFSPMQRYRFVTMAGDRPGYLYNIGA